MSDVADEPHNPTALSLAFPFDNKQSYPMQTTQEDHQEDSPAPSKIDGQLLKMSLDSPSTSNRSKPSSMYHGAEEVSPSIVPMTGQTQNDISDNTVSKIHKTTHREKYKSSGNMLDRKIQGGQKSWDSQSSEAKQLHRYIMHITHTPEYKAANQSRREQIRRGLRILWGSMSLEDRESLLSTTIKRKRERKRFRQYTN
jgi:hypothetical protein